jgi:hypothetical protein
MTSRMKLPCWSVMVCFFLLITSCEYLPLSAGALKGDVVPVPDSWSAVAQTKIIQLETQPADPYSVNLWTVEVRGNLYVFAGDNRATWVDHIAVNSSVRLQAAKEVYALSAERVTEAEEFEAFAVEWEKKYGNRPQNEQVDETYLFRLRAR